ncbi:PLASMODESMATA CALLOSE-BINDING PROTEIN 2-like [Carex rostrata]
MAALVYVVLILSLFGRSDAAWCVCRTDVSDSVLQKAIDYACGAGADCSPTLQNGPCSNPNTVKSHCNYAVNSYYQRKGQTSDACNFAGSALVTSTDPSYTGCTFPATQSAAGTSTTSTTTTTPGTGTTTGTYNSPPGTIMGGLGPSGNSMSTDSSDASFRLVLVHKTIAILCFSLVLLLKL